MPICLEVLALVDFFLDLDSSNIIIFFVYELYFILFFEARVDSAVLDFSNDPGKIIM